MAAAMAAAAPAGADPLRRVAQASPSPRADLPIAYDSAVAAVDSATILTFRLTRPVAAAAFVLERPDRVVIDLPEVNFQLQDESGRKPAGLARSFRFGLFGAGRSRIVIDLAQPAIPDVQVAADGVEGRSRLVIRLTRTDRADFVARAARDVAPPATAPTTTASLTADARPLVVIDPGHGGIDPGASAKNGLMEKTLVFDAALAVKEKLVATGRYRVLMTRDEDVFVSLGDRVKFARQVQADLLISLHADSIVAHDGVRGATIYTGSERASDPYSARLAESENLADSVAGADAGPTAVDDVNDILVELTRRETRVLAHRFARTLVGRLGGAIPMHKSPLRSAGFRVLAAPDVPSVLIELGYLTNPADIALLTSAEGRARASAAIVTAVDAYFVRRGQP